MKVGKATSLVAAAALLSALVGCVTRSTIEVHADKGAVVYVDSYMDDQYKGRSAIADSGAADASGTTSTDTSASADPTAFKKN
jgi:hypothetical protein